MNRELQFLLTFFTRPIRHLFINRLLRFLLLGLFTLLRPWDRHFGSLNDTAYSQLATIA
jgi:hypothetical protein